MANLSRPRQSGVRVFWTLLEAIERSSQLETQALMDRDFESLDVLQEAKRADFARLVLLGVRLGLNRNDRALDQRLRALEMVELRNAEFAKREARRIQEEILSTSANHKQLRSLRQTYGDDSESRPAIAQG